MASLKVNSKSNCVTLSDSVVKSVAQSTVLNPGTHVIRMASGTFSFWGSGDAQEPFVILWILGGTFTNLATNVRTSSTYVTLNGYHDSVTLNVSAATTLHAFFIDSATGDNRGEVELSILQA